MNISMSSPLILLAVLISNTALADRENDMWQQFKAQKGMSELDAEFAEPAPASAPEPKVRVVERIVEVEKIVVVEVPAAAPQVVQTAPEPVAAPIGTSMVTAESDGYVVKFGDCRLAYRNIKCRLHITNMQSDGGMTLYGNSYSYSSKLFDRNGNEYPPSIVSMGNKSNGRSIKNKYIQGVTARGSVEFKNVNVDTKAIALFELSIHNSVTAKYDRLLFRDVDLGL